MEGEVSAESAGCRAAHGEGAGKPEQQSVYSSHLKYVGSGPFRRKPQMKAGPSTF